LAGRLPDQRGARPHHLARLGRAVGRRDAGLVAQVHRGDGEIENRHDIGANAVILGLKYFDITKIKGIERLPYCLKIVAENLLRQGADLAPIHEWLEKGRCETEIGFKPARVLMPDSSGIPLMGDLAAMRDAMIRLGGDPGEVNPAVPVDLVIDHSVMVDEHATKDAVVKNLTLEIRRNAERYAFLRWA